jgi:hypothetical protein
MNECTQFCGGKIYFMIAQRFFSRFFLDFCAEIIGPVQKFSSEAWPQTQNIRKIQIARFFWENFIS